MVPDTSLEKTVQVAKAVRLWWSADARVPVVGLLEVYPVVNFRTPAGAVSADLSPQFTTQAVASSPNRYTLTLGASYSGAAATFALGDAHVLSPALGAIPVRVASISGTTATLTDPMPYDLPDAASCLLQSALWYSDEGPGNPVATETRTVTIDQPVPYTVTWTYANPAGSSVVHVDEGVLHVVRQPFVTGLTSHSLRARWPEVSGLAAVGSAGFEAIILRTSEELALRVRAAVREAGFPAYGWETDVNAGVFLPYHAMVTAAAAMDSTSPERAELLRQRAEPLFAQALATTWADRNRDGVVDAGEVPGLIGSATAAQIAPSYVPTPRPYGWSLGERR